jgi:GNAT superfamily N-acetyltransferase
MNAALSDDYHDLMAAPHLEPGSISAIRSGSATEAISQKMDIVIRAPTPLDIPALATLFSEMQRYYRRPVAAEQATEGATLACQPVRALFDPRVLVAEADGTIIGSIVLNVTFPAFELSRSLYIRDLYVTKSMRRHGIGQALVQAAAHLTYAEGYSAIDWTTETDNVAARQMYESCGARVLPRTYYRLAREDMTPDATNLDNTMTSECLAVNACQQDDSPERPTQEEVQVPGHLIMESD